MAVPTECTGGVNGNHCCWIAGELCQYLDTDTIRCTIYDTAPDVEGYAESPVGRSFAERFPGFTCRDWPQNIPEVMAKGVGLCCWGAD